MVTLLSQKVEKIGAVVVLAIFILAPICVNAASTVPKPSTPEFTLKFVDYSYSKPTTYTMDLYTGQQEENIGYYVQNKCIVLTIKNQPFTPTIDLRFFYNVRIKGQYEENWTELYRPVYGYPEQTTNSDYTTIAYQWNENGDSWLGTWEIALRAGGKAQFQVQALIGQIDRPGPFEAEIFMGEKSAWTATQTITIGESGSTVNPTTTGTPSQSQTTTSQPFTQAIASIELDWKQVALILIIVSIILATTLTVLIQKSSRLKKANQLRE